MTEKKAETDKEKKEEKKEEPKELSQSEKNALFVGDLLGHLQQLSTAVSATDLRTVARLVAKTNSFRKRQSATTLSEITKEYLKVDRFDYVQQILEEYKKQEETAMDTSSTSSSSSDVKMEDASQEKPAMKEEKQVLDLPEISAYLVLLFVQLSIDKKEIGNAVRASTDLVQYIQTQARHTIAALAAQAYFFYSRSYELEGKLEDVRSTLLAAHRTASIRKERELQATLINLLLRNYLHYNQYDPAHKLIANSDVKEGEVSANQYARYMYYDGRIKAIQLHYKEAERNFLLALRKSPQYSALGFRITCSKLLVIVELLTGQVPDRHLFNQKSFQGPLKPYYELTKAVRRGDLPDFRSVVERHREVFLADKTFTLIQRVHQNVIKTGLRKINVAYSSITIKDICRKLGLEDGSDAEFMVAKAIRDEVIEASIVHDISGSYMKSKELADVYSTQQPQEAFNDRIQFFLNVHNEAVKAMRFPDKKYNVGEETEEERKERIKEEQDIAKILEEEDEMD